MRTARGLATIVTGLGAAAVLLAGCSAGAGDAADAPGNSTGATQSAVPGATDGALPQGQLAEASSKDGQLAVTLTAAESQVPFGGSTRWAMTYNGQVSGPTLRVRPGDRLTVTLVNDLPEATSLHTHGLHVSPEVDNPFLMVMPGESHVYAYDIPKNQQAGTYWYHPHVHEKSAEQVASGLSGAIVVENDSDAALDQVSTDRVLVVNDPPLAESNPWGGGDAGANVNGGMDHGGMGDGGMGDGSSGMMGTGSSGVDMMTAMMGRTGPRLLTNGAEGVTLAGSDGKLERVHLVNATASSALRLTFSGAELRKLSSTGARLGKPEPVTALDLAPGERTELVLVPNASGGELKAQRLSNEGSGGPVGVPEVLATVQASAGTDVGALPASLTANERDLFAPDVKVAKRRVITLDGHMNPTIDGVPFNPDKVNFTARKGTVEEWVIESNSPMVHPIHLHTWPFQVKGEQGWTDIVSVPAGTQRVIRIAFDDFGGKTVLHCHILDHEDNGMMAVIEVD